MEWKSKFVEGKLTDFDKLDIPVQLDHFDKRLKKSNGWDQGNLFAVFSDVNHDKNRLEDKFAIDSILKPDSPSYRPDHYLAYDSEAHIFRPNTDSELSDQEIDRTMKMIKVLGLNNGFIVLKRSEYLEDKLEIAHLKGVEAEVNQFPTAFAFLSQKQA
jgi:hypothetical protein